VTGVSAGALFCIHGRACRKARANNGCNLKVMERVGCSVERCGLGGFKGPSWPSRPLRRMAAVRPPVGSVSACGSCWPLVGLVPASIVRWQATTRVSVAGKQPPRWRWSGHPPARDRQLKRGGMPELLRKPRASIAIHFRYALNSGHFAALR
jgi:hypothetical protein